MALPSGYTQLGYLRATGTQYINMFYQPKLFGRVECKFKFHTTGRQMLLGSWGSATNLSYVIEKTATNNYNTGTTGVNKVSSTTTSLNVDQWYELDYNLNQNYISINGNTVVTTSGTSTCTRAWYLFASNDADEGVYLKANASIEYLRLYDTSGILVHNYIPAYSEYVNDYGLFDAIDETFHQNDGTGKFEYPYTISASVTPTGSGTVTGTGYYDSGSSATLTAIPNSNYAFEKWISNRYYLLTAIESSGTQYIDTGVVNKTGLKFIVECSFITGDGRGTILGQSNSSRYSPWISREYIRPSIGYKTYNPSPSLSLNEKHRIEVTDSSCIVNGVSHSYTNNDALTPGGNIWLFRRADADLYGHVKLNLCQIYDGNTLIRNFIPCMDYTDLTVGLLDLVEMKFYKNSGTGSFQAIEPGTGEYISITDNPLVISNISNFLDFTAQFKSIANCRYKVNGTWKNGTMYIKENGTWKSGTPKIKVNGAWKEGG